MNFADEPLLLLQHKQVSSAPHMYRKITKDDNNAMSNRNLRLHTTTLCQDSLKILTDALVLLEVVPLYRQSRNNGLVCFCILPSHHIQIAQSHVPNHQSVFFLSRVAEMGERVYAYALDILRSQNPQKLSISI